MQTIPAAPKRKKWLAVLCVPLAVIIVLAAVFFIYSGIYYPADESVLAAVGEYAVAVQQEEGYITILPAGGTPAVGYIFYPGGKVQAEAYLPYLAEVAQGGYFCVLLQVPFRLAILDGNAAAAPIADYPDITRWAVGGHSLGGVAAAGFAKSHAAAAHGLVLLAAYPADDLSQISLPAVSITATEDRVLNWNKYEEAKSSLPAQAAYVRIEGGNHSQFGRYGLQEGDGMAYISPQEQQTQAADATLWLLAQL